jgi:hypothetical protein
MNVRGQVQQVQRELETARKQLEISRQQKFGLESALAKRIGTEEREISSLVQVACADPRQLAVTIVKERNKNRKRVQQLALKLNDQMHLRTRAELALRDIRLTARVQTDLKKSDLERTEKSMQRLRFANQELEQENSTLTNRCRMLEDELLELQAANHVHKANSWEQAFAMRQRKQGGGSVGVDVGGGGGGGGAGSADNGEDNKDLPPWAFSRAFQDRQQAMTQSMYDDIERLKFQMHRQAPQIPKSMSLPEIGKREVHVKMHGAHHRRHHRDHGAEKYKSAKEIRKERENRRQKQRAKAQKIQLQKEKRKEREQRRHKRSGKKVLHRTGYYKGIRSDGFLRRSVDRSDVKLKPEGTWKMYEQPRISPVKKGTRSVPM